MPPITHGASENIMGPSPPDHDSEPWWKAATFYQVYPASFKDSNGDGWGDLAGLMSELDHLRDLGVDCIWLSPIFQSPQADMGYDVSDYQRIHAPYGTVADLDALIGQCHARDMRLILDLVVNHTSVAHPWFLESRSCRTNPKRDWYIWKPPRYSPGGQRLPPTNWRSYFAGSTWTYDDASGEYYLHLYSPSQPDLNWDNAACRQAIYAHAMRFWLDRGVDGFRIDTVNKYSKHPSFADAPVTDPLSDFQPAPHMWCNGPRIHAFLREMRALALAPYGAVAVGELSNTPRPEDVVPYVSAAAGELDMAHEFSVIRLGNGDLFGGKYTYTPFALAELKRRTARWQGMMDGTDAWTTVFVENHDNGRAVSRFGDDGTEAWRGRSARVIALWQATLSGTVFLYQGREVGMVNMPRDWVIEDEYRDIEARSFLEEAKRTGDQARVERVREGLRVLARDHSRLPMQWTGEGEYAGFMDPADGDGEGRPWMRVHDGFREVNVQRQRGDEGSVLEFYKAVLKLRKRLADMFVVGRHELVDEENEQTWSYLKLSQGGQRRALVVMNFTRQEQGIVDVAGTLGCELAEVRCLVSTIGGQQQGLEVKGDMGWPGLQGWEGRVYTNFEP